MGDFTEYVQMILEGSADNYEVDFKDEVYNVTLIVDMTNMTKRSRSFILNKIPDIYTKNAIVFNVPKSELLRRLKKREMETGKSIPLHVVDNFINSYERPTNSEFDNIIYNK